MVPAGNKAKRLSSANHTTKTIHHHHHHHLHPLQLHLLYHFDNYLIAISIFLEIYNFHYCATISFTDLVFYFLWHYIQKLIQNGYLVIIVLINQKIRLYSVVNGNSVHFQSHCMNLFRKMSIYVQKTKKI